MVLANYTWIVPPVETDSGEIYVAPKKKTDLATGDKDSLNRNNFLWRLDSDTQGTFNFEDQINISNPDITGLNYVVQNAFIPRDWELQVSVTISTTWVRKKLVT
tara:strand:- start:928 stop:1239 length:312 start_codon:yes stop_codon:yes gene_type:complete